MNSTMKVLALPLLLLAQMLGQDQTPSVETGTLNIGISTAAGSAMLLTDSAITRNGKPMINASEKTVQLSPVFACGTEGHESDLDLHTLQPYNLVADGLRNVDRRRWSGDIDRSFETAKASIAQTLRTSNKWREEHGYKLLRHEQGDYRLYHDPGMRAGRLHVTGLICIGLRGKTPTHREANFETDASGTIYIEDYSLNPADQGARGLLAALIRHKNWPQALDGHPPEPTTPEFQAALRELRTSFAGWPSLSDLTTLRLLDGVYWSTISVDCGEVLPPVNLLILRPGAHAIIRSTLPIQPFAKGFCGR